MWMGKRKLTEAEIKSCHAEELILVNVNRIYSKYAEVVRNNLINEYKILLNTIDKINDEKEMYTVMEAGDIITCFLQTESEYPPNTFLSKNEKKNTRKHEAREK